jgi:hypothetical protein
VLEAYQKTIVDPNSSESSVATARAAQESTLNANVLSGAITTDEADKMLREVQTDAIKFEVYNDPSTSEKDSSVLKELKDTNGRYSYLDSKDRLNLIQDSQRRIAQNIQNMNKQNEIIRDQKNIDIYTKMNEGTITLYDLEQEAKVPENQGGIPIQDLVKMKESMQAKIARNLEPIIENDEDANNYLESIAGVIDDKNDKSKVNEIILNYSKNGFDDSERAYLATLQKEMKPLKDRKDFMDNAWIPFKNTINSVNKWVSGKEISPMEHASMIKKMINKIYEGKDPEEARKEVVTEVTIIKNPDILNFSDKGQLTVDSSGSLKIMFPDTSFKDYSMKGGSSGI